MYIKSYMFLVGAAPPNNPPQRKNHLFGGELHQAL